MKGISTNAGKLAQRYGDRAFGFATAIKRGLVAIATRVDRAAVKNLSGSGAAGPGSYPVPVRTGHLRRAEGFDVQATRATVFNIAAYARAVHEGLWQSAPSKAGPGRLRVGRPFIADAAATVDAAEVMAVATRGALIAAGRGA